MALNRLKTVGLSSPQLGVTNAQTMSLEYDAAGNITKKDGVVYHYDQINGAGPHAVSSRADGMTYHYDSNGNNTSSSDGRTITYTAFNKPSRIERDAEATEFSYGPDRNRYRRVEMSGNVVTEEAIYIGNTEVIYTNGGYTVEFRRNIGGIAIERFKPGVSLHTEYVLRDNLGSPHTLLDELGQVTYRLGFDPHGSRRQGYDPRALIEGYNPAEDVSDRGFTGHEHLDGLGVIHMNGRIYDPGLGRFLQADPLIQDLSNPQSLNRYTYVFNNPLAYTDPSGYGAFSNFIRPILAIGVAYFTGGWASSLYAAGNTAGALAVSVGGGALAGAIATGSSKGALIGAFTGAAAFGVGSSIASGNSNGISNAMAKAGAQALAGGLQGQVNNGNFGAGFMSGFSVEFGFDTPHTSIGERSQSLADLNARDASSKEYALVMGTPEDWYAYESSPILRATVPGQVSYDYAVTAWENGAYGQAALYFGAMLGEQVLTVASFGYGTPAIQTIRAGTNRFSTYQFSDFYRRGPTTVSNQLILGQGAVGAQRINAIKGGGVNSVTGASLPFHYHIHRYNWYRPWTWFKQTPIIKQ